MDAPTYTAEGEMSMGVYIKDMEMPTEEQSVITINIYSDGVVTCYDDDVERKAVPVPDHGRLIYADALNNTPFMIAAIDKVITERRRQIEKWGEDTDNSPFEWMSILGEEFGELCEAINETFFRNPTHPERGGYEKIIKEASQVAAVALAIIESSFAPYTIIPAEEEKS